MQPRPEDVASEARAALQRNEAAAAIAILDAAIAAAAPDSADAVRQAGRTLIRFSPELAEAEQGLKRFLFDNVYRSEAVMAPVRQSQEVVSDLFEHYLARCDLPGHWGEAVLQATDEAAAARIVCDFVAGMTDPYALEQHARLFDAAERLR